MPIIYGTNADDTIKGTSGADEVYAGDGDDDLYGSDGNDYLTGGIGNDYVVGGPGNDYLDGGVGGDYMRGGPGDDVYIVDDPFDYIYEPGGEGYDAVYTSVNYRLTDDIEAMVLTGNANLVGQGNAMANYLRGNAGANILDGGLGADIMAGGLGDDTYYVESAGDFVFEAFGEGVDTVVTKTNYYMPDNVENLILGLPDGGGGSGNALDNRMTGAAGNDDFLGFAGDDTLAGLGGNDVLNGGAGNDWLVGGTGMDRLNGGNGGDRFVFGEGDLGTTKSTADWVQDFNFSEGDRIDLTGIDANVNLAGDQAFAFIGTTGFSGVAGQLRYELLAGERYLQADVNGDGAVDLWLKVDAYAEIAGDHFLL